MTSIEEELSAIKERNLRVEKDKAWETSNTRVLSICILVYLFSALTLKINIQNPLLGAVIPVLGFYISTPSLSFIRKWWEKK